MRSKVRLGSGPGFAVWEVRCAGLAASGWSSAEASDGYWLVFVRTGLFRRRVRATEAVLDPAVGYWERPGDEQQVAHPVRDGDVCTAVILSEELMADLAGGEPAVPDAPVFTAAAVDLAHRELAARARRGAGALELGECVTRLAADLGFADHAHLTRTVREQLGHTPAQLRRLLEPQAGELDPEDSLPGEIPASRLTGRTLRGVP